MALPIRDGNQSLTTLSTIIVNSAHVPAHSVVSLGSQAITDIAQAVSGVELGPNTISALENISVTFGAGTSVTIGNIVSVTGGLTNAELRASSVTVGGSVQVSNFPATQSVTFSNPTITGSVSILNLPATQAVTFTQASVTFSSITGSVSVLNFPATQTTTFSAITGSVSVLNLPATQTVTFTQASVTFGTPVVTGSVSVLNFPSTQTIAGTVTANVPALNIDTPFSGSALFGVSGQDVNAVRAVIYSSANSDFGSDQGAPVDSSNPLPVTGTVAINGSVTASSNLHAFAEDAFQRVGGYPIGSGQTARVSLEVNGPAGVGLPNISGVPAVPVVGTVTVGNSVTIGSLPAISGTVTANTNLPNFDALTFSGATLVTDTTVSFASGQILWAGASANQSTSLSPTGTKGRAFLVRFFNDGASGANLQGQFFGEGTLTGAFNNNNPSFRVEPAARGWNNAPIAVLADNVSTYYLFVAGLKSASETTGATHEILPFDLNFGVYTTSGTGYGRIAIYKINVPPELALNSVIHGNLKSWLLSPTATVTVGNSITVSSLPAITGSVSISGVSTTLGYTMTGTAVTSVPVIIMENASGLIGTIDGTISVGNSVTIASLPAISGTVTVGNTTTSSAVFTKICGEIAGAGPSEPKEIITDSQGMLYARLAPSSSLVSDPVVYDPTGGGAFINIKEFSGTTITTSNFTSTTASTAIASSNSSRKGLTIFNEGAGDLYICAGTTATTASYQVRLSSGDYWECPSSQTSLTHSAQFASAGTARVVQII